MTDNLAVFTLQVGVIAETFIRRHLEDLMPGRSVAVARFSKHELGGHWQAKCPVLFLDRWEQGLRVRLARRAGMPGEQLRAWVIGRYLRKHDVSVILGEYLDQFVDFVPTLDRLRIPYVVQGHGTDVSAALRRPEMAERYLVYRSARAILTRCEFHRERLIRLGLPADKVHVNPGGVDVPEILPSRGALAAKHFLAIGRMVPKKGPIYLLEAFRRAAAIDSEITLDYIGAGELLSAANQFVDAAGLSGRVRLHGAASETTKHRLLRECGVFVQHSLTDPETGNEEGLPAAIQEAMAHGMAIISTRHSGIPEAVEDGVTGWLSDECDAEGMAQSLMRISSLDGTCQLFGAAAHNKAIRIYSWAAERSRLLMHLAERTQRPATREERGLQTIGPGPPASVRPAR